MVDYQTLATEIKDAEKRISANFVELGTLDYQRAEHFYDYFKHNRTEDLDRFRKETIASRDLLKSIRKDFHKIRGSILVVDKMPTQSSFQNVLKRARYMENLLDNFFEYRKTQMRACRSFLRSKEVQNPVLKKGYDLYKRGILVLQEKRLILSFGKERDLVAVLEGHFKDEKERIDAAFQEYLNEQNRNTPMPQASLNTVVVMPTIGASLALAVHAGYQWANRYCFNHKMLVKSAPGGKDGPTV